MLQRVYILLGLCVIGVNVSWLTLWLLGDTNSAFVQSSISVAMSIILMITYFCLRHVMNKYHHFEYKRTRKTMFLQFILFELSLIINYSYSDFITFSVAHIT